MLHRVGEALGRLLKPIKISDATVGRSPHSSDGKSRSTPDEDPKKEAKQKEANQETENEKQEDPTAFQKFDAKKEKPAEAPQPEKEKLKTERSAPGLTTALVALINQLRESRNSLASGLGLRAYKESTSQKKGAKVRKGIVVNQKSE